MTQEEQNTPFPFPEELNYPTTGEEENTQNPLDAVTSKLLPLPEDGKKKKESLQLGRGYLKYQKDQEKKNKKSPDFYGLLNYGPMYYLSSWIITKHNETTNDYNYLKLMVSKKDENGYKTIGAGYLRYSEQKKSDQPLYRGRIEINKTRMQLSAWESSSKTGLDIYCSSLKTRTFKSVQDQLSKLKTSNRLDDEPENSELLE